MIHTYDTPGTYTVSISGDFPRIYSRDSDDPEKILTVEKWGDIEWTFMADAFYGASNLTTTLTDEAPDLSLVTSTAWMFQDATSFDGQVGHWDVSTIENMVRMFYGATIFDQYIGGWNTGNATDISGMFNGAGSFDQDISTKTVNEGETDEYTAWDVSNVDGMEFIFTNQTRIVFSGKGTANLDPTDALKKSPAGLAEKWLSFYSLGEEPPVSNC